MASAITVDVIVDSATISNVMTSMVDRGEVVATSMITVGMMESATVSNVMASMVDGEVVAMSMIVVGMVVPSATLSGVVVATTVVASQDVATSEIVPWLVIDSTATSKVDEASVLVTGMGGCSVVDDGVISTSIIVVESTVISVVVEVVAALVVTSVGELVVFIWSVVVPLSVGCILSAETDTQFNGYSWFQVHL